MKKFLFATALLALFMPAAPQAQARTEVSVDFFYNNLTNGNWIEAGDYGYCWQPGVAASNTSWRPYTDGYWAYTDVGWTWVSYEDFGWATYHYGRWARLPDYGWVWVPGTEWGPAWVSWRTGGDYVGWAPLPPRRHGYPEPIYEGRPITGYVDIDFDIGPVFYNFVDIRYIGEPVLRERIFESSQNITYINQTVNVTNITYNNGAVYNYGPDYQRLNQYSSRPIQRLKFERERNVDPANALQSGAFTKVQGDRFVVAAPQRIERKKDAAPKEVKAKLEKPNFETGWSGVSDPEAKAKLQEKFKKEDRKSVPPPQMQPSERAADNGKHKEGKGVEQPANAGAVADQSADRKGKGDKGKHAGNDLESGVNPPSSLKQERERAHGRMTKGITPNGANAAGEAETGNAPNEKKAKHSGKSDRGPKAAKGVGAQSAVSNQASARNSEIRKTPDEKKAKGPTKHERAPHAFKSVGPATEASHAGKHEKQARAQVQAPHVQQPKHVNVAQPGGGGDRGGGGKHNHVQAGPAPQQRPQKGGGQGGGKPAKEEKKKGGH